MRLRARPGIRGILLGVVCLSGLGCQPGPDTLDRIRAQGFIRAGYAQEPPWAFLRPDGIVDGEGPRALRGALGTVGVDSIRWVRLDFDDLLSALEVGRVDVVASGLFRTPERLERARLTRPTACASPALAFRRGEEAPGGLAGFLEGARGRLAVIEGSVEQEAVERLSGSGGRVVVVPDLATGLEAVRSGAAGALSLSAPTLGEALARGDGLDWEPYEPPRDVAHLVEGCSALAVRTSDPALFAALEEGLTGYVGSNEHLRALQRLGQPGTWRIP